MKSKLITHKNIPLLGKHQLPIVTDFIFQETEKPKPVLIFCHGYKGFKDWGAWQLMFQAFAEAGLFVVAFNFSHNGGTLENPIDFPDLEAFGNDNFSKQQDDLQSVIDEVLSQDFKFKNQVDTKKVILVGHSRGGGVTILKTANEPRVTHLVSLAPIKSYADSMPTGDELLAWKNEGVKYVMNGRTKQNMPLYYQLYENFMANKEALDIEAAASSLDLPHIIFHGRTDNAVPFACAEVIEKLSKQAQLIPLDTDHVFGAFHPWNQNQMPPVLESITNQIIEFVG